MKNPFTVKKIDENQQTPVIKAEPQRLSRDTIISGYINTARTFPAPDQDGNYSVSKLLQSTWQFTTTTGPAQRLLEVSLFHSQHGRLPHPDDDMKSLTGGNLGEWIASSRRHAFYAPLLDEISSSPGLYPSGATYSSDIMALCLLHYVSWYRHLPNDNSPGSLPNGDTLQGWVDGLTPGNEWYHVWADAYQVFARSIIPLRVQQCYDFCRTHNRFMKISDQDPMFDGGGKLSAWVADMITTEPDGNDPVARKAHNRLVDCYQVMTGDAIY